MTTMTTTNSHVILNVHLEPGGLISWSLEGYRVHLSEAPHRSFRGISPNFRPRGRLGVAMAALFPFHDEESRKGVVQGENR